MARGRVGQACRPRGAPPAGEVILREAGPADQQAARQLHRRCSPRSLAHRYPDVHPGAPDHADGDAAADAADRYLPHLLDRRHGRSVAAVAADGAWVGLGHLLWDGAEAEMALLVADAWQRRGVGTALLARLLDLAARARCAAVYAVTRPGRSEAVAALCGTVLSLESLDWQTGGDTLVVTARLAPPRGVGAVPTLAPAMARRGGRRCCGHLHDHRPDVYRPVDEPSDPRKAL